MKHPYTAKLTFRAKTGKFPALRGELYENGVLIARFERKAVRDHYVPPITYKFLSSQSQSRFDDFADCLSIEESIDALLPL